MEIWPWCPLSPVTVSYEWSTGVLQTKEAEQRISNRDRPRIYFQYSHNLDQIESREAWEVARAVTPITVPDWTLSTPVDVLAGAGRVIPLTTAGAGFSVGALAMLWNDSTDYEVATVTAVTPTAITLTVVQKNRTNALLMPAYAGSLPAGVSVARGARRNDLISVTLEVYENPLRPTPSFTLYDGLPVLDVCPKISQGPLTNGIDWELERIDNGISTPHFVRVRNIPNENFRLTWQTHTRADANRLKDLFYYLRGKNRAFYFPTFARDFWHAFNIAASDDTIVIFANRNSDALLLPDFHIEIATSAGAKIRRKIIKVDPGEFVNGLRTLILKLDSPVGVALTGDQITRISALYRARLETDRIEFIYQASSSRGGSVHVSASAVHTPAYDTSPGSGD